MADVPAFTSTESFPRFQGEKLFLSSSSDMRHIRHDAQAMLESLLSRLVTERRIDTYEWETCIAEKPFDQRLSMQENLSRPSDPNCVGLICLLGERIGFPLRNFDPSTIPDWEAWSDPTQPYHVVYPWPLTVEEQLNCVNGGGFPLSGTVFEALDALGAGRNTHIAYFADRAVTPDDPDVCLNGLNWQTQILKQLPRVEDKTKWLATEYTVQTKGLTNFLNALNLQSRDLPVYQTSPQALAGIRRFVETRIAPTRLAEDNPYRFLDFYDILDGDDLPGREEDSRAAVAELRTRASSASGQPMIARISGESGCGKTSFMRAGILAVLNRPKELGKFRVMAVRPTDFHDENGRPDGHLPARLLTMISLQITDLGLSLNALDRVAHAGPKAAQVAIEVLVQALAARGEAAPCIVVGIDQFEEILDDLGAIDRREYAAAWKPLLSFVELAVKSGRFGFVYTLESSRQAVFERIELPEVFRQAYEVRLGGHDDRFLEAIITKPFEKAGFRLAPRIVNELLASYKSYSEKTQGHASTLPLLSLKLSNLFDTVQNLRGGRTRQTVGDGLHMKLEEQEPEVSYEELKSDLRLDNEIEELANVAWGANNKPEDEQIEELNYVLKPLVSLSGDDMDKITLQTVGEALLVNLDERLSAFEAVRLIIRENGRRRLVHEAVIRQWPLAANWLARKQEYLIDEAKFRTVANAWQKRGEDLSRLPKDQESIDMAAVVLRSYLHEWPYCVLNALSPVDRNLRKYCEAIFQQSETPKRTDSIHFLKALSHVHMAAAYGMTDLVERFVSQEPDCVNLRSEGRGVTPLDFAAWSHPNTTRLLLARGANPINFDTEGWPTLASPVWRNDPEIFRILAPHYRTAESIKAPAGMNLLHVAARRGAVSMLATLLSTVEGIDPMQQDDQGSTALDFAARYDQPEAFTLLLKYYNIKHPPAHGWTVLHRAARNGALRVVDEILNLPQFHDLVNATTLAGETALMIAASQRQDAVVRRLVAFMDPNAQVQTDTANKGWTALHYAVAGPGLGIRETRLSRQQALRTVRALLAAPNIEPSVKAADGKEPIALATSLPYVRHELIQHPNFAWSERLGDGSTPLNFLIGEKDRQEVERMLRKPDLDVELLSADGSYVLHLLINNDMADLALKLLQEGRVNPWNVAGADNIGFAAAVAADNEALISAFLETLPETRDQTHRRELALAAKSAILSGTSPDLLDRLIELDADPAVGSGNGGLTLFHYAALVGNIKAFDQFSLRSPVNTLRDTWGRRPSDLAPDHLRPEFESRMKDSPDEPPARDHSSDSG